MTTPSIRRAGSLALGVALAAAAGGCARPASTSAASGSSPVHIVGALTEVYAVPAAVPVQDGTLYRHVVGSSVASDAVIARGTDATFVAASGGTATGHLQWYSSSAGTLGFARPDGVANSETMGTTTPPLTSLDAGNVHYAQVDGTVVATAASGVVATYPLPNLTPDAATGGLPAGYKGVYSGQGPGVATALLATPAGHVLAFTSTGLASAVTDLMTHTTVALSGYGNLGNAVSTASGQIVVLAWRQFNTGYTIRIVTLDATLHPVATADTGLTPSGYLRDRVMVGAGHAAVVSIAHGDDKAGVTLNVYAVDGGKITARPTLPLNVGLEIAPATGTSVYIFNGPAANTVGEVDLATGALTRDLPSLRAPAGSYVVGIYTQ